MVNQPKCSECPLEFCCNKIHGRGPSTADLVVVGEAPTHYDTKAGKVFSGQTGTILQAIFQEWSIPESETWFTNTLLCQPKDQALRSIEPPAKALQACHDRLISEIRSKQPKIVVALGEKAANALLDGPHQKLSSIVGAFNWLPDIGCWMVATYHPNVVLTGGTGFFDDIYYTFRKIKLILTGELELPDRKQTIEYTWLNETTQKSELIEAFETLANSTRIALDLETDGFSILEDPVLQVALSTMEKNYVFEAELLRDHPIGRTWFKGLLQDPTKEFVIHNCAFDLQFIEYTWDVAPTNIIDTMCLALGVTERGERVGLKSLAREWLNATYYEAEIKQYLPNSKTRFSAIPRDIMARYAAADGHYTIRLVPILTKLCEQEKTLSLAHNLLIPAQRTFAQMEARGVLIDTDWAQQLEDLWVPQIKAAELALQEFAEAQGFDARTVVQTKTPTLNVRSPKQLQNLLFDILRYKPPKGVRTTGEDFKQMYPAAPVTKLLRELQEVDHLYRTYVKGILDDVEGDGRAHPDFLLFGTVTGRLAIHNPPLQIIPKWGVDPKRAKLIRRLFKASPGYVLLDVDYAQLELRIAWHLSKDPVLGAALMSGDFHTKVASRIFKKPESEVTGADRFNSKFVTFGIQYGRQAYSLANGELQCSESEAQTFVDEWFALFPTFHSWWLNTQRTALETGRLQTQLGRVRHWNLITPQNMQAVKNQAVNFETQSTASDLCLTSAIRLNKSLRERDWGYPLYTVHDEIVFEVREEILFEAADLVYKTMTDPPFETCATFDVELSAGPSWGEQRDVIEVSPGKWDFAPEKH